jgi:FAT domain.
LVLDFEGLTSFSVMVRAQMLSELEEIIAYKQYADQPERQQTMRKTWMKRYVKSLTQCGHPWMSP